MVRHEIEVQGESIRLGQFLKLSGAVEQGSAVKDLLASGLVRVNDEVENRRGRQLVPGDTVTLAGTAYVVTRGQG